MQKKLALSLIAGLVVMAMLAACGGSGAAGNDPYAKFIGHYENMLKILKDNKANPQKANQELVAYQQKNEKEIDQLADQIEKFKDMDPLKAMEYATKIMQISVELEKTATEMGISGVF